MLLNEGCFLAQQLLMQHGLAASGWRFALDRAKRRNGCCKYREKEISLSEFYITNNVVELVRDTILHEIAHALVGPGHHHNHVWKAMCVRVGARPVRCKPIGEVVGVQGRWRVACPNCPQTYHMHRRPKYLTNNRCGKCKTNLPAWSLIK